MLTLRVKVHGVVGVVGWVDRVNIHKHITKLFWPVLACSHQLSLKPNIASIILIAIGTQTSLRDVAMQ